MTTNPPIKREHGGSRNNRRNKKRRYKQYSNTVSQKDLGKGSRGFLISCTPKHENQCFRDALVLFDQFLDTDALASSASSHNATEGPNEKCVTSNEKPGTEVVNVGETSTKQTKTADSASVGTEEGKGSKDGTTSKPAPGGESSATEKVKKSESPKNDLAAELEAELSELKSKKNVFFEHIDTGVRGSVFVRVRDTRIDIEDVVERIMVTARESGAPGCRFCQKILPIYSTCYASPKDAATTALSVVEKHFPEGNATFGIEFKHRVNTGAHRDDYIPAIGNAIRDRFGSRFTVNLKNPDVVLIVEIVKTSCCIGTFKRYRELGKLNVREAAKPEKVKSKKNGGDDEARAPKNGGDDGVGAEKEIEKPDKIVAEVDDGKKEGTVEVEDAEQEDKRNDSLNGAEHSAEKSEPARTS